MLKNRKFQMLFTMVLIVFAFLATIAAVNTSAPSKANLAWPPRPDFWPLRESSAAEDLSDYYQRHSEQSARAAEAVDMTDYFFRHPELQASTISIADISDYFLRHPELRSGLAEVVETASDGAPLDECYDVSLSEVTTCRKTSQ